MNATSIKPIGAVQSSEGSLPSRMLTPDKPEASAQAQPSAVRQEKSQAETQAEGAAGGSLSNISILFRMDDKTNSFTIFLIDRKSRKVLRSIPASELRKMQIGDLLKLTA